jgi:D-alanyl-D-alanine dipeptidase
MSTNNIENRTILQYPDLISVAAGDSEEPLIDVKAYADSIEAAYSKMDMIQYTGLTILVRDSVAKKLAEVHKTLQRSSMRLRVVYGYRHPAVQQKYFLKRKTELKFDYPDMDDAALDSLTHDFVAVPDVAGHPSGGAVDVTILDSEGTELDMGNIIAEYADPDIIKTFARVSKEQSTNRKLLHDLMIGQGFAPFYGEWWHFSYGDREWAAFYNKKALYGAVDFRIK